MAQIVSQVLSVSRDPSCLVSILVRSEMGVLPHPQPRPSEDKSSSGPRSSFRPHQAAPRAVQPRSSSATDRVMLVKSLGPQRSLL